MRASSEFRKDVLRVFKAEGARWLEALPDLFVQSTTKWNLSNCRLHQKLSMSLICLAESPAYGHR